MVHQGWGLLISGISQHFVPSLSGYHRKASTILGRLIRRILPKSCLAGWQPISIRIRYDNDIYSYHYPFDFDFPSPRKARGILSLHPAKRWSATVSTTGPATTWPTLTANSSWSGRTASRGQAQGLWVGQGLSRAGIGKAIPSISFRKNRLKGVERSCETSLRSRMRSPDWCGSLNQFHECSS